MSRYIQHPDKFFLLEPDSTRGGRGHGVVFENVQKLRTPPRLILRPREGGFPKMSETPLLVYSEKKGDPPQDLEGGMSGYWLVSERLKNVFERIDPEGFEFAACDYRLEDGSAGPRYFLCDVVRVLDAVDEGSSKLTVEVSEEFPAGRFYDLTGGWSLVFRSEVVSEAHVFRTPYSGDLVICDRVLRDAIVKAGIYGGVRSNGLWFTDASDI